MTDITNPSENAPVVPEVVEQSAVEEATNVEQTETADVEDLQVTEDPVDVMDMSDEEFEAQMAGDSTTSEEPKEEPTEVAAPEAGDVVTEPQGAVEPEVKAETDAPKAEEKETDESVSETPMDASKVFEPFKANGKTVQAKNAEEAVRLMQMGAGHVAYQKRVKPALIQAATLETNGITPERLNFLVEIHNGDPEAIKKLVRDAGIDPYDISTDDAAKAADKNYQPKNYSATEAQVNLQTVLSELGASETGSKLLSEVRTSWDDASRRLVQNDPEVLRVLDSQKQSGIYDRITAEVDRRRTLGEFTGRSFIETYHQVGQDMDKAGAFNPPSAAPAEPAKQPIASELMAQPKVVLDRKAVVPKTPETPSAVAALAPVRSKPASKPLTGEDILAMSDEDFEKMSRFA